MIIWIVGIVGVVAFALWAAHVNRTIDKLNGKIEEYDFQIFYLTGMLIKNKDNMEKDNEAIIKKIQTALDAKHDSFVLMRNIIIEKAEDMVEQQKEIKEMQATVINSYAAILNKFEEMEENNV